MIPKFNIIITIIIIISFDMEFGMLFGGVFWSAILGCKIKMNLFFYLQLKCIIKN